MSDADDAWDRRPPGFATNPVAWDRAVGQASATAVLRSALREDAVPHAWLLVGEDGIGQDALVAAFTAALECERTGLAAAAGRGAGGVLEDEGCGACTTCLRIARGTWSAQPTFEPEGAYHLVGAVRDRWMPAALRTSTEGSRRVLRVRAADRMNEQAQNAFLKVLEEPPAAVVWWLEVADETRLLDTIVSRVRRVDLRPWRPDDLVAWAVAAPEVEMDATTAAAVARAAGGSPVRLAALATDVRAGARAANLDVLRRLVEEGPHVVDAIARDVVAQGSAAEKELKRTQAAELDELPERFGVDRRGELPTGVETTLKDRHKREARAVRGEVVLTFLDDLGSWLRDLLVIGGRGRAVPPTGGVVTRPSGADGADGADGANGADGAAVGPAAVGPAVAGTVVAAHAANEPAAGIVNRDRLDDLARDAARFEVADLLEALRAVERCRVALTEHNGNPELQLSRLLLVLAGPAWEASRTWH